MRPVSEALLNIITGSHTSRVRVRSVTGFPQSVNPVTTSTLNVLGGTVKMESSAKIRATVDVEVQDRWGDLLPAGVELLVEYGVEIAGGQTEWVSLGYYRLDSVHQDKINGPLRLTGSDRMAQVIDTEPVFPWVSPAGITHRALFTALLYGEPQDSWFHPNAGVFPSSTTARDMVFDYDADAAVIPYPIVLDRSFHDLLQGVADTVDKRMFFDYLGRLNVVDAAVTPVGPVHTLTAGQGGTLRGLSRQVTRDGVYNSVRAEGSAPTEGNPPWAYDLLDSAENPLLSWYGRFGRVLTTYSSPLLTTSTAAAAAAETIQAKIRGLPYELSLDVVANPALEPLDPINVSFPGIGRSDSPPQPGMSVDPETETHVIDGITFPLTGGDMTITTRAGVLGIG